ncbi:hypothetical protein [Sphingomonas sp. MA1305]|uniref:hypothetical protein n=1 Tax=Sphingomonas sp. MA1305 TaxID=2479204 RepID=UPI0018E0078F
MELIVFRHHAGRAFALGLALRLLLVAAAVPVVYAQWFLPFLANAWHVFGVDPWTAFLAGGGAPRAFPYGPLYLAAFAPLTGLGLLVSARWGAVGLSLSVLAFDLLLFAVLRWLLKPEHRWTVVYAYWLSPIVLYINYWHGQLDVFPVAIMTTGFVFLRERHFGRAGVAFGLATAAKMSMGIAIPFVWMYTLAARRIRAKAPRLIAANLLGLLVLLPCLASSGFRTMVLETPERDKAFSLTIGYGDHLIYVMPVVFLALLIAIWRMRRFNFAILMNAVGMGFFVLFLLTPASPGWSLWLMPFLVFHLARGSRSSWLLAAAFAVVFVLFHAGASSGAATLVADGQGAGPWSPRTMNLLLSLYVAAGGLIAFRMGLNGVVRDPFFRATRRPLVLGIAGDSGAGKDTLAAALGQVFGANATSQVSGDDYHSWDRQKPMWRAMTHLHPAANDLRRFEHDIMALRDGHVVEVPHYDHRVGRMTKPHRIAPTDVIVASGLHALFSPELAAAYDLGIFLDMDRGLRIFLKLQRDTLVRGHHAKTVLASIERREPDSQRFIEPQRDHAGLVLSLQPLDRHQLAAGPTSAAPIRMALRVSVRQNRDLDRLTRILVSIAGMTILPVERSDGWQTIEVSGAATTNDIIAASRRLVPEMADFLSLTPQWQEGLIGVMQLAVLDQLSQALATIRES